MSNWKWEADRVLPVWTADSDDIGLDVRRHGRRRFGWSASCSFQIENGIDEIGGVATSLKEAKRMAEAAALRLETEP